MQSLSSGVIKNLNVEVEGDSLIDTEYDIEYKKNKGSTDEVQYRNSYDRLTFSIISNAREQAQKIIEQAKVDGENLKKIAYDTAYENGFKEGYEIGYDKSIEEAQNEKDALIKKGEDMLYSSKEEYEQYFKRKEKEIIDIILSIANKFLCTEVKNIDSITSMVKDELSKISKCETVLLKFNPIYYEEISKEVQSWKMSYNIGEIFLLTNEELELGTVIIEKENGKCRLSLPYTLEKIKEELLK